MAEKIFEGEISIGIDGVAASKIKQDLKAIEGSVTASIGNMKSVASAAFSAFGASVSPVSPPLPTRLPISAISCPT